MSKSLENWMYDFANSLPTGCSATFFDAIITVCHRINQQAPSLFSDAKITNKSIFQNLGKPISLQATTQDELEATALIFSYLYEFHVAKNSELKQPIISLPLKDEWPMIDDNTPPLGVIEAMKSVLFSALPSSQKPRNLQIDYDLADIGQTILLIIYKSGLTKYSEVNSLIQLNCSDWFVVNGNHTLISALLPHEKRRVYLSDEAILAMHKVLTIFQTRRPDKRDKKLDDALMNWKAYAEYVCRHDISKILHQMSIHTVIKYISFLDRSLGLSHLWSMQSPIENHTFIRAFSGHLVQYTNKGKATNTLVVESELTHLHCATKNNGDQVKRILETYALQSPKQQRNTREFKDTKAQLLSLCKTKMSWPDLLLTQWLTSLFLHGSPWKNKLAISTLTNYYSTITRFIKVAWRENDALSLLTTDFELLCQQGISSNKNADEQRTILRFLNYCAQHSQFPRIDSDSFELLNRSSLTRAHYVAPQHFDDICQGFCPSHHSHPIAVLIVMQLCYYAGLREDEAVSLYIQDIDFDLGMLYITNRKKRKSANSVRKVPLFLIPSHILQSLAIYIEERNLSQQALQYEQRLLIEAEHYYSVEAEFIKSARQQLKDDSIVTHSFRHSAANNWCYLLSSIIFDGDNSSAYFFNQHALFSSAQKELISNIFAECGTRLTPYFPVLDWVSEKLGHSNVKVTLASYLHILDWIAFSATTKPVLVLKDAIRYWTSNSNYGFERQKQLLILDDKKSKTGFIDQMSLSQWVQKYWLNSPSYNVHSSYSIMHQNSTNSLLSFSQFVKEIEKLALGIEDHQCHHTLQMWLKNSGQTPTPFFAAANQASAWLKLCVTIDKWPVLHHKSLTRMKRRTATILDMLKQDKDVTQKRQLHSLLVVYTSLNLPTLKLKIHLPNDQDNLHPWLRMFDKFGVTPVILKSEGQAKVILKPYASKWSLWHGLSKILYLIMSYIDYIQSDKGE